MTASCSFAPRTIRTRISARTALRLALACSVTAAAACATPRESSGAAAPFAATGEFLPDGSCRVLVDGVPLFAPGDRPHSTYDAGPVADVAPAGYALRQLTCAPTGAGASRAPGTGDERMLLVTLYVREGASLHAGGYAIQPLAADDSAGAAARASVAIFGAPAVSRGAGVRYLEGREGTLTVTSASPGAGGGSVAGTFSMRAGLAWSM